MVLMVSAGLALPTIAARHPESGVWELVGYETSHAEWQGCTLWDLIQPSFMFLVGVALPFSLAARRARGHSWPVLFGHAAWRAVVLVLLGIFLMSNWSASTEWTFVNVLTQIGLGYVFLFLLAGLGTRVQVAAAVAILCATWWLYASHPLPPPDFDPTRVGVDLQKTPPFTGLFAHWNKNANIGHDGDLWFLNLFNFLNLVFFKLQLTFSDSLYKSSANFSSHSSSNFKSYSCSGVRASANADNKKHAA